MQAPRWLGEFREDLEAFEGPRVCALGTRQGRVRMVVLRDIGDDGSLAFASDARSRKNADIRKFPQGEACFWINALRVQWRLEGGYRIETAGSRWEQVWDDMSPRARALFLWPDSGRPFDPAAKFAEEFEGAPVETYELIVLEPSVAERLDLTPHPHRRVMWEDSNALFVKTSGEPHQQSGGGQGLRVNP